MATAKAKSDAKRRASKSARDEFAFYVYGVAQQHEIAEPPILAEGVDGWARVEAVACEGYLCWLSRVSREEFVENLPRRMEDLQWLVTAGLRHQQVVAEIGKYMTLLPARFGTVFTSQESLAKYVGERRESLQQAFDHIADADEWGVKVFALQPVVTKATTKDDGYMKRTAQALQSRHSHAVDTEVQEFVETLSAVAEGASPAGTASADQPGLLWNGAFLIRRKDRKKFESVLRKYAAKWHERRRIDCSGPWPPYSFAGGHVH